MAETITERRTAHTGIPVAAGLNILLGIIVIALPFLDGVGGAAFWNNLIVGVLVVALASWNAWVAARGRPWAVRWTAGGNATLGVWLVAWPFFTEFIGGLYFWGTIIAGAVLLVSAGYNVYASAAVRQTEERTTVR